MLPRSALDPDFQRAGTPTHRSHFYCRGCGSFLDPLTSVGVVVGANQVPKLWCPVSCLAPQEFHSICTGLADKT